MNDMYGKIGSIGAVVCTNKPAKGYPDITIGNTYIVVSTSGNNYYLSDDEGDFTWYESKFFSRETK